MILSRRGIAKDVTLTHISNLSCSKRDRGDLKRFGAGMNSTEYLGGGIYE